MKKINVNLYGGKGLFGGRETPLEAEEIYCDRYEQCSYYQAGKCLKCRAFLAPTCKFGRTNTIKGYTSRARKYYSFKNTYENDEVYSKLKYPSEPVAIMGDTLYIHYCYGTVRKRTEQDEKWVKDVDGYIIKTSNYKSSVFIPLNEVTNNLLFAIFSNKPRAIMGSHISEDQCRELERSPFRRFVIATDNDEAGRKGAQIIKRLLIPKGFRFINLRWETNVKDINDLVQAYGDSWCDYLTGY